MNLSPSKVGAALTASTLSVWVICSLMVQLFPEMMLSLSSHMLHIDMSQIGWSMSPFGALIGAIAWSVSAFCFGWLFAKAYNFSFEHWE